MTDETKLLVSDIVQKGMSLATFSVENLNGFISGMPVNELSKEDFIQISEETESMYRILLHGLLQGGIFEKLTNEDLGFFFQYAFDRTAEVTYKKLVGMEVDTVYNFAEASDYYELDIPEYLQEKITKDVGKIGFLTIYLREYIDSNGYRGNGQTDWFIAFLMVATMTAVSYMLEADLNADDEWL